MDCSAGAAIGRQLAKDAMNMHGGVGLAPTGNPEQDALMNDMMLGAPPPPGMSGEWAQHFAHQQHHHQQHQMAMQRQQNEAAMMRQQREMEETGHAMGTAAMLPPHLMGPMMPGVGFGGFMMAQPPMMPFAPPGMMRPQRMANATQPQAQQQQQQQTQPQTPITQEGDSAWADNLRNAEWAQQYDDVQVYGVEGEPTQSLEGKTKSSAFYAFMDQIRRKEVLIDEEAGQVVEGPGPDPDVPEDTEYLRQWAAMEGLEVPPGAFAPDLQLNGPQMPFRPPDAIPGAEVHADPVDATEEMDEWAREYAELQERQEREQNRTDYPFEPNNPYLYHDTPMEEGRAMLQVANLAEAALAFEAVCQKDPKCVEGWRLLGKTQAENEKDPLAIIALNHARMLNPKDIAVHAALAVSHTNEHNAKAALQALRAWLLSHPQYEHLGGVALQQPGEEPLDPTSDDFFFAAPTEYSECCTLFNAAIEMNPTDYQLHANLGVLHNLSHQFDAAAMDFRRAVELRPEDAELWNKLGATLANGNKPKEALEAYGRALDINPGYVRVMYNMAVAYSNSAEYALAAKQITRAIVVQDGGTKPQGEGTHLATRGMWDLLRIVLNIMERTDLVELSWKQDITPFLKEFGLEDMMM